jgi:hypothetical protein
MTWLLRPRHAAVLTLTIAALNAGCRADRRASDTAPPDSSVSDSAMLGAADSSEVTFLRWWVGHARRVALHLREEDPPAPVDSRAEYALAGADTAAGDGGVAILDLVRQGATLPDIPGTFSVFAFPEWERQVRLWVPENGDHCVQQQAALVIGGGDPARFELNPLCQAANVPYDLDGVAIRAYYPTADAQPWIEFSYDATPCSPVYLFRWATDREAMELVHALRDCSDAARPPFAS